MRTNLLDLPLKRTDNIRLRACLTDLINEQFAQRAEDFGSDLARLETLRSSMVEAKVKTQDLAVTKQYYKQVFYLSKKLPIELGLDFTWYNLDSAIKCSLDDLTFERANVLYNVALHYAGFGVRENRSTIEGLKRANQHFQISAGCFILLEEYIKMVNFVPTEDLQPEFLACLRTVVLAQAQECIWQKAVLDQMRDKLIAQLSEQVSQFYHQAAQSLEKSTAISTAWMHHLRVKQAHFAAAAQVRMSAAAMSSNKYGEEVARLRFAQECCIKAQQSQSYVSKAVALDLKGLMDHIQNTLSRAEKDNDMIYLDPVPSQESLASIVPQVMVKAIVLPELRDPLSATDMGDLLFQNLVPIVVRNMVEIFEQRKQELISKEVVSKLHALDLEMQAQLQELGLPGSLAVLEQPLGLPPTLLSQSEEVRQRGGTLYLTGLLEEVGALALANSELVDQIVDTIDEANMDHENTTQEQAEDDDAFSGYRHQIDQYHTFLTQAKTSDDLVQAKLEQWHTQIDLLASDSTTLARALPSAQRITLSKERESCARRVRIVLNSWELVFNERKAYIRRIQDEADSDDIGPALAHHAQSLERSSSVGHIINAESLEPIVATRLAHYDTAFVRESATRQRTLVQDIVAANNAFLASGATTASHKDREMAIQSLSAAYHKYREIMHNLGEGAKFYNDAHKALCRVSDEVMLAVQQQALVNKTRRLSVARGAQSETVVGTAGVAAGTWKPENGISFGGGKVVVPQHEEQLSPSKRVTRSSAAVKVAAAAAASNESTRSSHVFDPTKHAIRFASK